MRKTSTSEGEVGSAESESMHTAGGGVPPPLHSSTAKPPRLQLNSQPQRLKLNVSSVGVGPPPRRGDVGGAGVNWGGLWWARAG